MKRIIKVCLLFVSGIIEAQTTQNLSFNIKGEINDVKEPAKVVLMYDNIFERKRHSDTAALVNGKFYIKGTIAKPQKCMLVLFKSSEKADRAFYSGTGGEIVGRDGINFYLDKGEISVSGASLKTAQVKGSAAQVDYEVLQNDLKPVHDKIRTIETKMGEFSPEKRKEPAYSALMSEMKSLYGEVSSVTNTFIKSHLDSYVSWDMVAQRLFISNPQEQKELLYKFSDKFLNSVEGKRAIEILNNTLKTAIGQTAPDFVQNDVNDKPVRLSDFRGKYVLLDFWASWCSPCRAEHPNYVKAYNNYRTKNFTMLSVSLDRPGKKDAWLAAIKNDGLEWVQVSDLKYWDNEVARLYNVRGVPANFLLSPDGKIIAKDLRGENLEKKLAEIFEVSQ